MVTLNNTDFGMAVNFTNKDELAEAVYALTKAKDVSETEKLWGLHHVNDLCSVTQNEDSTYTLWGFGKAGKKLAFWSNGSELLFRVRHTYKTKGGAVKAIKINLEKLGIKIA